MVEPFSKWGGTSARQKYINFLWFELAIVTSHALKRDVITCTPYERSKLHYLRQNYTTMKTYRWNTWNSIRLLRGRPRSTTLLEPMILFYDHSSSSSHYLYWLSKAVRSLRHWNFYLLSYWLVNRCSVTLVT